MNISKLLLSGIKTFFAIASHKKKTFLFGENQVGVERDNETEASVRGAISPNWTQFPSFWISAGESYGLLSGWVNV